MTAGRSYPPWRSCISAGVMVSMQRRRPGVLSVTPGAGSCEEGSTFVKTAIQELAEKTGLRVEAQTWLPSVPPPTGAVTARW